MEIRTVKNFVLARLSLAPKPVILEFEITHRCNLACTYCDRNRPLANEMSVDKIIDVLDEFYALGMRYIGLDGGEPLTHNGFDDIVQWLHRKNVVIHLNSNGTLIKKKIESVKLVDQLKISLDGHREVHDRMRGAGSFDKALEGALLARRNGVATEFRCVLGKHNINAVNDLIDLVERLDDGITVTFQPARNSLFLGSNRNGTAFMLDNEGFYSALKKVEERKIVSKRVANKWGSLAHFRRFPANTAIPCAAGWVKATLDPQGYLFHCAMVSRKKKEINVIDRGVTWAFQEIERRGCAQCWCARAVEGNLAWGGQLMKLYRKSR